MKSEFIKRPYLKEEYTYDQVIEISKCMKDPIYFMRNYMKVQHPTRGAVPFDLYSYQEKAVKAFLEHKDNIVLAGRQQGKTSIIAGYLLWLACFRDDKNILVASKDDNAAKDILDRIRFAYEELPMWIKPGTLYFSKHEISFENNSKIKSTATTDNTGRGASLSCVSGDTLVSILKEDGSIADKRIDYFSLTNFKNYKISTNEGYKTFKGVICNGFKDIISITFEDNTILKCSYNHKLLCLNGKFIEVQKIKIGTNVISKNGSLKIKSLIKLKTQELVYDVINVKDTQSYYTNNVISHNCLMIDELAFVNQNIQEAMWRSLAPTLSTGGALIISSTPNGEGDLFARLWRESQVGGMGSLFPTFAPWYEHPDRGNGDPNSEQGRAYEAEMKKKVGSLAFRQEYACEFLSSDPLLISSIIMNNWGTGIEPLFTDSGFSFWETINPNKEYLIGCDVAEGIGKDFSTIQIFDTKLNQVAEFRSNTASEAEFYEKIKWIINFIINTRHPQTGVRTKLMWSYENNSCGKVISTLYYKDEKFPEEGELISVGEKIGMNTNYSTKKEASKDIKRLLEASMMTLRSKDLIIEFKNYSQGKTEGIFNAKPGATDDLISACLIITRLFKFVTSYDDDAFDRLYKSRMLDKSSSDNNEPDEILPMPMAIF